MGSNASASCAVIGGTLSGPSFLSSSSDSRPLVRCHGPSRPSRSAEPLDVSARSPTFSACPRSSADFAISAAARDVATCLSASYRPRWASPFKSNARFWASLFCSMRFRSRCCSGPDPAPYNPCRLSNSARPSISPSFFSRTSSPSRWASSFATAARWATDTAASRSAFADSRSRGSMRVFSRNSRSPRPDPKSMPVGRRCAWAMLISRARSVLPAISGASCCRIAAMLACVPTPTIDWRWESSSSSIFAPRPVRLSCQRWTASPPGSIRASWRPFCASVVKVSEAISCI